ncbi:hypothetical protein BSL78_22179 [Apostichopus japonicus]|uniref:Uncharacterized protein n=1 Tax=Stichopus japonicus TaxID=307972 RepID=A0A2G8JYW0_STIJA|nr:hypothetical protein BSL78_22179 [Apostichopus japonicus]
MMSSWLALTCAVLTVLICNTSSFNVDSICGLDTTPKLVDRLESARSVATNWLSNKREPGFGWSLGNTASAVTSLQLVNQSWVADPSLDMRLTIKELQLEILSVLSRSERTLIPNAKHLTKHHRVTISRLPSYVMALHATCHDNTDFHGINLISLLEDNMRQIRKDVLNDHYQQAQGILAMCSTGHRVRWQYVEDLLNRQRPDGCFHKPCSSVCTNERIDTTSMVLSAFTCVHNTTSFISKDDKLRRGIDGAANCLLNSHESHGSFGNAINNALASQALLSAGVSPSRWNCHATVTSVIDAMHEDGHFGSLAATIHILPLLAGRHHSHIKELEFACPEDYFETPKPSFRNILPDEEDTINVTLEIQDDTGNIYHRLEGASGESLLDLMYRMQALDVYFSFESEMTEWGEYITSINGIASDQDGYRSWIIEQIVMKQPVCIDKGVGDIHPEDGDHYKWIHRGCTSENDIIPTIA